LSPEGTNLEEATENILGFLQPPSEPVEMELPCEPVPSSGTVEPEKESQTDPPPERPTRSQSSRQLRKRAVAVTTVSRERPFQCPHCSRCFKLKCHLADHVAICPENGNRDMEALLVHQCPQCPQKFRLKNQLNRHLKRHNGDYSFICQVCGMGFLSQSDFTRHKKTHSNERPHTCPHCNKSFKSKHYHMTHIEICSQNAARNEKTHSCHLCSKTFSTKALLKRHLRRRHMQDYTVHCEVCGMGFLYPYDLKVHSAKHSDERPHKCVHCSEQFKTVGNLNGHMKICSKNDSASSNSEVRVCPECGR
jgi:KRAB domain-containing zinc finger protein